MVALTQDERIRISEKVVKIPGENAQFEGIKDSLGTIKIAVQSKDNAHKKFVDSDVLLINGYQVELGKYDGNQRTELTEQDFTDSVNRIKNNPFFPNDPLTPTPNLPNGVWTQFLPYAYTSALGRKFDESYAVITKEQDKIDSILSYITTIETFTDITRSTGQHAIAGVFPDPDIIEDYAPMQAAATSCKNAVQDWEDFINTLFSQIVTTDTDITRSAQNIASKADITSAISIIDVWQALADFDTNHGQTTAAGFNSYDVNLLNPTKFRAAELQPLKDELTARQAFLTIRMAQLNSYLGTIVQNLTDGSITSSSGFYGTRFGFITLRLHILMGSLTELKGLEQGQAAQQQMQDANNIAANTYDGIMKASLFRAPAAGTNVIHLMDATNFSIGNAIYVVADNQEEISANIINKENSTVFLDQNISKKYTRLINARLYRLL
ncbi:MAG TPA: hypothetical protein VI911_11395 [Patescibacteria group bacterium]|nr:hypothetical protein [Patescibacteria group bacterium]